MSWSFHVVTELLNLSFTEKRATEEFSLQSFLLVVATHKVKSSSMHLMSFSILYVH